MIRNRATIGRNSAGPRPAQRRLNAADVIAERDRLLALPSSPEKVKGLTRCRGQMESIRNRVERHG